MYVGGGVALDSLTIYAKTTVLCFPDSSMDTQFPALVEDSVQSPCLQTFMEPMNRFRGIDFVSFFVAYRAGTTNRLGIDSRAP